MFRIGKLLVLSLLVVSFASSAMATTSRVEALAGTANYINDDSNVFRWYGTLPSYSRMVMAEGGQVTGGGPGSVDVAYQALGFTHNWGEDHWLGTWAIYLLYNSIEDGSFFAFNPLVTTGFDPLGTGPGVAVPTTKFVLQWGNEIDMLAWGLSFTRSDASTEITTGAGTTTDSFSFTTFGGGVRWDIAEAAYLDLAADFGVAGGENDSVDRWDSGNALSIAGRLFYEWLDDVDVVPYLAFQNWDFNEEGPTGVTTGHKGTDFQAGVSLNMDVNTNNMLIFATEVEFVNIEPSQTATGDQTELNIRNLPKFFVALESDITSWLTTRVGATKTMARVEEKDAIGDETVTTGPAAAGEDFAWSLGAGFHVGEWDIDAVFTHEMPFRLGYWLTGFGVNDADSPITRVSGTYRF